MDFYAKSRNLGWIGLLRGKTGAAGFLSEFQMKHSVSFENVV